MSKENNLTDFMTDLADTIREAEGSTDPINPQDFSDRVRALGGGLAEFMMPITHAELKTLRDSSQLVAGMQYRITDYQCTTTQENTQSAGHQFDIIVTADSTNTLNENARACLHEGDTYFAECDLNAWELKYCLDNDTARFFWAREYVPAGPAWFTCGYDAGIWYATGETYEHEGATYYIFYNEEYDYTFYATVPYPTSSDEVFIDFEGSGTLEDDGSTIGEYSDGSEIEGGQGVIYYMKDEWSNELPYDFKNIMYLTDTENYVYTFANETNDDSLNGGSYENIVRAYYHKNVRLLPSNFFGRGCHHNKFGQDCNNNTFGNLCEGNTFGDGCGNNTFGNNSKWNLFGSLCDGNTFGNYYRHNILDQGVSWTTLKTTSTTSSSNILQYVTIDRSVRGKNNSRKVITADPGLNYQVIYKATDITEIEV